MLYLGCWSRQDIAFAVSEFKLSRFVSAAQSAPCRSHMVAAKHLLRYLNGTKDLGLVYSRPADRGPTDKENLLWGYVDSDWAGCPDSRKSTSGYVLMLNGPAVSWKSKKQSVVALSSAEAEFVATSCMMQEVIYTCRFLENLGFPQLNPTQIFEDNARVWLGRKALLAEVTGPNVLTFASILCMPQLPRGSSSSCQSLVRQMWRTY